MSTKAAAAMRNLSDVDLEQIYIALIVAETRLSVLARAFNHPSFTDRNDDGPRTTAAKEKVSAAIQKIEGVQG